MVIKRTKAAVAKKGATTGKEAAGAKSAATAEKGEKDGRTFGITSGLKLVPFVAKMLRLNEKAEKGDKKTDEALVQELLSEFKNRRDKMPLMNIRGYRWRYNKGDMTLDEKGEPAPPKTPSQRYDENGEVWTTTRDSGLTPEQLAERLAKRQKTEVEKRAKFDERFKKHEERKTKEDARRKAWEEKFGELPEMDEEEEEEEETPKSKKKPKAA